MDTNVTTAPDLDEAAGTPLGSPIRLPGARGSLPHDDDPDIVIEHEESPDHLAAAQAPSAEVPREKLAATSSRKPRRKLLLATTAVVLVSAGLGSAAWTQRQRLANFPPVQAAILKLHDAATGLLAAAVVPNAQQTTSKVGVPAAGPKSPVVAVAPPRTDPQREIQAALHRAEFASFKPGAAPLEVGIKPEATSPTTQAKTQTRPAAANPTSAPSGAPANPTVAATLAAATLAPSEAGVGSATPAAAAQPKVDARPAELSPTATVSAAPPPVVATAVPTPAAIPEVGQAASAAPAPAAQPKPRDPIQTAVDLRAEPLSPRQQVEAVGLVRELGAQLKDTKLILAQLSATVADLKAQLEARTTEFDSRLSLAEAGTVLAESAKAGIVPPSPTMQQIPTLSVARSRSATAGRDVMEQTAPAAPASAARSVKDFRIQGASPGFVVLNALSGGAGEAPVLYLALGDQVPGLGRIKSIYQRGTAWVVQTDSGLIQ